MMESYDTNTTAAKLVQDFSNEIKGKVILTTGVSPKGLGATFVSTVAKAQPALLILAGRKVEKVQLTADSIASAYPDVKIRVLQLDLSSLAAVREAATTLNSWSDVPHIDVLVNNAGVMATGFSLTPDASKAPRVISVSSDGHRLNPIRWADYNFSNGDTYNKWHAYGQSKTANVLMAVSLAEKLGPRLRAYSLHPGVINTGLDDHLDWNVDYEGLQSVDRAFGNNEGWRTEFPFKTLERGAATHVFASFSPALTGHNGAYLQDSQIADPWVHTVKPWATSPVEAERLWKLSEKLVGQKFTN